MLECILTYYNSYNCESIFIFFRLTFERALTIIRLAMSAVLERTQTMVRYAGERFERDELLDITTDLDREWREAIDFDHATPANKVTPGVLSLLPTIEPSTVYKGGNIPDDLEVRLNPTSG